MGPAPSQAKPSDNEAEPLTINHPRFAALKVVAPPTEEDEGMVEIAVALPSESEFKRWQKRVGEVGEGENLFLPLQQRFQKTEFCGSGGVATIGYKYYPYLLSDEVVNRCNMEAKSFEESELWYLVYSIIQAADTFHARGLRVGDIRPLNVFISPEGQVRVATQFTWPGEQSSYLKTAFEKEVTYLSPEELKDISYGKLEESPNFALHESFAVGLTCLDAATLTDSSALYTANNKFNYTKLEERLLALEKGRNYSQPLVLLIKGLCQVEEGSRVTCKELAAWLAKYEAQIIDLQDFTVDELPEKLSKLTPERPRDSRAQQPQYPSYVQPPSNYITAPVRSELKQPDFNAPRPNYSGQYVSQSYQQYGFEQFHPSTYVSSGSGLNQRGPPSQVSNANPSIITFQKDNARSALEQPLQSQPQQPLQSQVKTSINLQQIDEQLQMSRKLFPS